MAPLPRPRHREDFEIAIICALQVERDAVEALLDEEYETDGHSYRKCPRDPNAYMTGRIGKHPVVLVYMPGMGKASSAAVASTVHTSFERIKVGIVVGICGGAPTAKGTEILLGDVIVSKAVTQVDFGRQYPDKFMRKNGSEDTLGRGSPEIRGFLGKVSGWRVHQRLTEKTASYSAELCKKDGFQKSTYPGPENDKLYPADYRHKHQHPKSCDICLNQNGEVCEDALDSSCAELGCDDGILISRERVQKAKGIYPDGSVIMDAAEIQEARKPLIHFGRIASGDGVMKSGQHRDRIVRSEGVIAFEMEGAGAWDYLPIVVIKSVCDYADSHKNKEWQGYAAATAATCTKAFIEEWRSADGPLERSISPEIPSASIKRQRLSTSIADTAVEGITG
ncbi:nucleoside phosphorylase domain-containing protein [Phaeosphaeriaceae sp. PMI808]|nr:nucleoside phosphorylase domain-containing protein [Phaeosphaeriaceae sp. PMI808]